MYVTYHFHGRIMPEHIAQRARSQQWPFGVGVLDETERALLLVVLHFKRNCCNGWLNKSIALIDIPLVAVGHTGKLSDGANLGLLVLSDETMIDNNALGCASTYLLLK